MLPKLSPEQLKERCGAIKHLVHDFKMLEAAGMKTTEDLPYPLNHFAETTFLVECRKFYDFFKNHRGPDNCDVVAKEFFVGKLKVRLPTWEHWGRHMDQHLMHLSSARVTNDNSETRMAWDGGHVHPKLLAEFRNAWQDFRELIRPEFKEELEAQLLR